jgi:nucleotide-binding universal stress UspA family protein
MKQEISKLHADDIKVEYCLREGNPEKIICEESLKKKIDLIIMGVSEKNMLVNFIYKSTASYVIDNVSIPVLVVSIKNK